MMGTAPTTHGATPSAGSPLDHRSRRPPDQFPGYIDSPRASPETPRKIRVSYPAGWTHEALRYLSSGSEPSPLQPRPLGTSPRSQSTLARSEAIAQSFPSRRSMKPSAVSCPSFSDISTLANSGTAWLDLFGNGEVVTVMNIDIGGGTADMAINRYRAETQKSAIGNSSSSSSSSPARPEAASPETCW